MQENSDKKIVQKIYDVTSLSKKKVLEVGCGNGRITQLLAGEPELLIGIEPEENQVAEARRNVPGAIFQTGSGENLPFSDGTFDLVIFTLSLHHQNSELAINEAERVLNGNGEIIIIEPLIEGELEQVFASVVDENQDKLNAQNAIRKSNLKEKYSEVFTDIWTFEDKDELCDYVFNYYDFPEDLEIKRKIIALLGVKSEDCPIEVVDLMEIQLLSKP